MLIRKKYKRVGPRLDPTPMADMVFQVLLFFMLTSPFMLQAALKIKLPKTVSAKAELGDKITLTISREEPGLPERFALDGREIRPEDLEKEIRFLLAGQEDKVLIIRADKDVPHGVVVEALDKAKLAGAEKLAIASEIATKKEDKARGTKDKMLKNQKMKK